jgi:hypothetical protein
MELESKFKRRYKNSSVNCIIVDFLNSFFELRMCATDAILLLFGGTCRSTPTPFPDVDALNHGCGVWLVGKLHANKTLTYSPNGDQVSPYLTHTTSFRKEIFPYVD